MDLQKLSISIQFDIFVVLLYNIITLIRKYTLQYDSIGLEIRNPRTYMYLH